MFTPPAVSDRISAGLAVLRIPFGLAFVLHGLPKVAHPFTWAARAAPGLPGWLLVLAMIAEVGGRLLLLLGALTPLAALLILVDMAGAFLTVTLPRGGTVFIDDRPGSISYGKNAIYLVIALCFLLTGPGRYPLDALVGRNRARSHR